MSVSTNLLTQIFVVLKFWGLHFKRSSLEWMNVFLENLLIFRSRDTMFNKKSRCRDNDTTTTTMSNEKGHEEEMSKTRCHQHRTSISKGDLKEMSHSGGLTHEVFNSRCQQCGMLHKNNSASARSSRSNCLFEEMSEPNRRNIMESRGGFQNVRLCQMSWMKFGEVF